MIRHLTINDKGDFINPPSEWSPEMVHRPASYPGVLSGQDDGKVWNDKEYHSGGFTALAMLAMRLRITPSQAFPFDHLSIGRKSDGTYVVFVIHRDETVTLEDGSELFPSDTLLAQLTMILKA